MYAVLSAVAGLAVVMTLLVTGAYVAPATPDGPCPARTSLASYADGSRLLLRAEPARNGTALLHLCASRAIGPVRSWSVTIGGTGEPLPAQRVSASMAIAAVPLAAARRTGVIVVARPETGRPLTFVTQIAAGAAG